MIFLVFEGLYSELNCVPPKRYAEVLNSGISECDLIFKNYFMYLFLAVLGLHCCMSFSPVAVRGDYSLVVVYWCVGFHCSGFSLCGSQAPGCAGLSSCLMWAQ